MKHANVRLFHYIYRQKNKYIYCEVLRLWHKTLLEDSLRFFLWVTRHARISVCYFINFFYSQNVFNLCFFYLITFSSSRLYSVYIPLPIFIRQLWEQTFFIEPTMMMTRKLGILSTQYTTLNWYSLFFLLFFLHLSFVKIKLNVNTMTPKRTICSNRLVGFWQATKIASMNEKRSNLSRVAHFIYFLFSSSHG